MKCSKSDIHLKTHRISDLQFEDQRLTSFAGLVMFQALFGELDLKARLNRYFRHLTVNPIYSHGVIVMLLMVDLGTAQACCGFDSERKTDEYL